MPNHVTNILTVEGDHSQVKICMESISTKATNKEGIPETMHIDFEKIVPMPETLRITSGTSLDNAVALLVNNVEHFKKMLNYKWVVEEGITTIEEIKDKVKSGLTEKDFDEARKAIFNIKEYGFKDWYDWSVLNWGTKWNAYDQQKMGFGSIRFDTAWSTPYPVIEKLAKKFPELSFRVIFADEDIGSNCGEYRFYGGVLVEEYQPQGTDAVKFAVRIKDFDILDYTCDVFSICEVEELEKYRDLFQTALENDRLPELLQAVDHESKEGRAKLEYLKAIAIENEYYIQASELHKVLS